MKMKAVDILWKIGMEEAMEKLDELSCKEASDALGIPETVYAGMTTEASHDYASDRFRRLPASLEKFMGLPNEVEIPDPEDPTWDEDTISEYLCDKYGFFHRGFKIDKDGVLS